MSAENSEHALTVQDVAGDAALRRLADLAGELGSERVKDEAISLAERSAEGRFYIACVGQFKRGKSTLVNALLGDRILPAGILPLTSVPTVVRYGNLRQARVRFQGGTWIEISPEELPQYVSEELNPENQKGVLGVEVFSPSRILAEGMCFVDTPGLGSVFAGNTEATRAFVPHIDAAIVVVGAEPPISGDELALVGEITKHVTDVLVVLNKADKNSEEEIRIAKSFTASLLDKNLRRAMGPIYEVSAEERLRGQQSRRDWDQLTAALEKLAEESRWVLARAGGERGFRRFSADLLAILSEDKEALARPIEETERRIGALRQTISEAETSLRDVSYLLLAEERHLSDMFLEKRKQFLAAATPKAHFEFATELKRLPRRYGPRFRREALAAAQKIAERHVRPWLQSEQAAAEEEYRKAMARFARIANDFLGKLAGSGAPEFARMPNTLDPDQGLRVRSRFTFEELLHVSLPASPLRYLADVFLGSAQAYSAIEKDAWAFLDRLLEMNSTRVQSDLVNRVQESRGQLEVEMRKLLHEVIRVAERALERARVKRVEGAEAVEAELARLDGIERELKTLVESKGDSAAGGGARERKGSA